ncbi:MAG: hypothetical protein WCI57_02855 [Candidatus Berkelbacteria bacterium]
MPKNKGKISLVLIILLLLAVISIGLVFIKIGLTLWFWLILVVWLVIFLLYLFAALFKAIVIFWLISLLWLIFSTLVAFGLFSSVTSTKSSEVINTSGLPTVNGISLSECTSTMSDIPRMLDGWKDTIYSAPYIGKGSNEVANANDVRTFSYKGLVDKTEPNSMHVRFEKMDGGYITGYATTMEVCNQDNKANYSYVTKYQSPTSVAGANTVASINYFHGGKYVFAPGNYRIDAYIRDTSGTWHLVDRMTGITITD